MRVCRIRLTPLILLLAGCHALPLTGTVRTDSRVGARVDGAVDVRLATAPDPGPMGPEVVRPGAGGRVAIIDVDGLLLNQNLAGLYSVGENPVAAFREKLEAAARDANVRAVVLRINSPGGGVTASDLMAEELRRFRAMSGKPAVACLLDLATGGAYDLAVGCDVLVAAPTGVVGGIGAVVNHYNLEDAMAQLNVTADPVKAGELVDMGSVTRPLPDEVRALLQEMADAFRDRFAARVFERRRTMTPADRKAVADGRVVAATKALALHLIDRVGYLDDAIALAGHLGGLESPEVVLYHRPGQAGRSVYAVTPNVPIQSEIVPFSYPGLDRNKLPTFLYLWQPDPTVTRLGGR